MRTVGAFEAKARLSQLLVDVDQARQPILIQRRGRSVAVLQPYQGYAEESRAEDADRAVRVFQAIRARAKPARRGRSGVKELIAEGRKR